GQVRGHRDLDAQLWQEIHDVFGATVDFSVALLTAIAFDFRDRHAMHADRGKRLAYFVELERFDDGDNELHGQAFVSRIPKGSSARTCALADSLGQQRRAPSGAAKSELFKFEVFKSGIFPCEWHKKFSGPTEKRPEKPLCRSGRVQAAQISGSW